jgi:hypothetical protein
MRDSLPSGTSVYKLYDPWSIVRVVAETDSTYATRVDFNDVPCHWLCPYCDGQTESRSEDVPFPHDQDCIVVKSRAMIELFPGLK